MIKHGAAFIAGKYKVNTPQVKMLSVKRAWAPPGQKNFTVLRWDRSCLVKSWLEMPWAGCPNFFAQFAKSVGAEDSHAASVGIVELRKYLVFLYATSLTARTRPALTRFTTYGYRSRPSSGLACRSKSFTCSAESLFRHPATDPCRTNRPFSILFFASAREESSF